MQKRADDPAGAAVHEAQAPAVSQTRRRRQSSEPTSAQAPRRDRPSRSSRLKFSILAVVIVMMGVGVIANPAHAAVDVVAPAPDEAVRAGSLRVVLRPAGDVRDLRVSLDRKNVTRRLRAGSDGGRRRTARIGTIRGVRVGRHHLEVSWRDGRGRRHSLSRRVLVGRRANDVVRVLGPVGRLGRSAKGSRMRASGLVRFRIRVSRGAKHVRLRVNGRVVRIPVATQTKPVRQVALGTRQGVRFGINRIQVAATRPRDLAYDRETLSVAVRRDRPLLSGLTKFAAMAGAPARLDARGGRPTAPGRRLQYRWRVVSRPPGSRAALRRASSATPTMRAVRPGRYRLRLTVSERRPGGARAQRGKAAMQRVTVDVTPDPVPLAGAWLETLPPGVPADVNELLGAIKVGKALYPTPDIRSYPYLLVLDARTLAPLNLQADGSAWEMRVGQGDLPSDDDVRDAVRRAVANGGDDPLLAVIAFAGARPDARTSIIDLKGPSSYVFTPDLTKSDVGISAGWSRESEASNPVPRGANISGWLAPRYPGQGDDDPGPPGALAFSPGPLVPYDTHVAARSGTNTMEIGGMTYAATLPQGATDGFHVLVLDSMAGVLENRAFAAGDAGAIAAMSGLLAGVGPNRTVLVQSMGSPRRSGANWNGLADRLRALGATPDVLLRLGEATPAKPSPHDPNPGTYALVTATGPDAQPDQGKPMATVAEASIVNSGGQAPGELAGALRPVGRWMALAPAVQSWGGDSSAAALWALAQAPQTDFPAFTSDDELQALKTISSYRGDGSDLYRTGGNSCYPQLTTLPPQLLVRASYCNTKLNGWRTWSGTLSGWAKEGSQLPAGYNGNPATFRAVAAQLAREFVDLAGTRDGFNDLRVAMANAKIDVFANLQADQNALAELVREADAIRGGIPGGHNSAFGFVDLGRELLSLAGLVPEYGEVFEVFSAIIGMAADSLELADGEGNPLEQSSVPPAAIQSEIATQFTDLSVGLAVVQDRLASDPRKLGRAGDNFAGVNQDPADPYSANWSTSGFDQSQFDALMRRGARRYLAPAYISAVYTAWQTYTLDRVRRLEDVGGIRCIYDSWGDFWNPFPFYPPDASYLPLDRDVPTMSWTLVRRVTQGVDVWLHNNPWNGSLEPEDPNDRRLAWEVKRDNAPPTSLLSLLFDPKRYNIPKSWFFPHGLQSVAGPLSKEDFSNRWNCRWPGD
jgi:hypothetical protein